MHKQRQQRTRLSQPLLITHQTGSNTKISPYAYEAPELSLTGHKLRWCRLPDNTVQYAPETTVLELRRTLIAEKNLNIENKNLRDRVETLQRENERLLNINANLNKINNDQHKEMQNVVINAQK